MNIIIVLAVTVFVVVYFGAVSYGAIKEYRELKAFEGSRPVNSNRILFIKAALVVLYLLGAWVWYYLISINTDIFHFK